jgi:hypothetical protein
MRHTKLLSVALAAILTFGAASPALADCCDTFWDCAATVVTEGVSCAMQEFINTVKDLINMVNNLVNIASGAAETAQNAARNAVDDVINSATSQSQLADSELGVAAASAKKLAGEESVIPMYTAQRAGTGTTPPTPTPRPGAAKATPAATGASNTHVMTAHSVAGSNATATTHSNTSAPTTTTAPVAQTAVTVAVQGAPRAFMSEMNRALEEVNKAKAAGDQDLSTVNRYIDQAKSTEGAGLKSAGQIFNDAINAPLKGLLSRLSGMLTDPTDLTSPSSFIESTANSIMADLGVNIDKVIGSIVDGPKAALEQAQPSYTDLQLQSDRAQAIATAMDKLYRDRTPAARAALVAMLPGGAAPAASTSNTHAISHASNHIAYSAVMTRLATSRDKVKSDFLGRFQGLNTQMKQYEAVRAKARTARASLPTAKSNFGSQLDAHINGKTQAERTAQRDSLIKEARSHFANDPKTRDAVINLLTSESNKRIAVIKR